MEADNSSIAKRFEPGQCVELRAAPPIFPANEGAISASARGAWPGWQAGQLTANSTIHLLLLRVTPSLPPYLLPCPPPSPSLPHSLTSSLPLSPSPKSLTSTHERTSHSPTHTQRPTTQPTKLNQSYLSPIIKQKVNKQKCLFTTPVYWFFKMCLVKFNCYEYYTTFYIILYYTILYSVLFCFQVMLY